MQDPPFSPGDPPPDCLVYIRQTFSESSVSKTLWKRMKRETETDRAAAKKGDGRGWLNLGVAYEQGRGVGVDIDESMRCYREALKARKGCVTGLAARSLSNFLTSADPPSCGNDFVEAHRMQMIAATAPLAADFTQALKAQAELCVGLNFERGLGVERDFEKACEWYARSAERDPASTAPKNLCSLLRRRERAKEAKAVAAKYVGMEGQSRQFLMAHHAHALYDKAQHDKKREGGNSEQVRADEQEAVRLMRLLCKEGDSVASREAKATLMLWERQIKERTGERCGFPTCEASSLTVKMFRCKKCLQIAYCGVDHQRLHWKAHKNVCSPSEVAEAVAEVKKGKED
uniref:MYND-type domain-containing protein n=1 Tax=Chromera velia CCMP2878 TaxID=1169474 RepID=A0A0G4HEM7_9ALVE|eukprot:Cvel_26822.t1-p1 / transcript=Cvel_26822.t1 / gene=Cvel_26822 / organism=Chromera_velia_CCMP2878 / gene_product=hypothetical protein / transcript_product=hypothetical protein / location=Cvel_scaffold3249:10284-11315(-) / protein_length=344 / sequence_SO=supercontig / SO=protein_coding / is_pseudo=false